MSTIPDARALVERCAVERAAAVELVRQEGRAHDAQIWLADQNLAAAWAMYDDAVKNPAPTTGGSYATAKDWS